MSTISRATKRLYAVYLVWTVATLVLYYFTGDAQYRNLIWNMLLALIPLVLSTTVLQACKNRPIISAALSIPWLLFLPNSFYVVTDLIHLGSLNFYAIDQTAQSLQYAQSLDSYLVLFTIFSASILGIIIGVASIVDFRNLLKNYKIPRPVITTALILIFALTGYGLYLGRFLRLNSWDVIYPHKIILAITQNFTPFSLQISALFALYVAISYLCFKGIFHKKPTPKTP